MFANAIEQVGDYTRPFVYIYRNYGETVVVPATSTMFFVNEEGCAVTSRLTAETILMSQNINAKYQQFKKAKNQIPNNEKRHQLLKNLELMYGYSKGVTVNVKCNFKGCVSPVREITCHISKKYDLAIIRFKGYENLHYKGYAVFADNANAVRPGQTLCRVGFPFPEINNAIYNGITDDIEWGDPNGMNTPRFPTDGMVTRHVVSGGEIRAIELSTPGIKGQSGAPLFDKNGIVYGMQYETRRLNLGYSFDDKGLPAKDPNAKPSAQSASYLHVSHCLSGELIKAFLTENGVKYYTQSTVNTAE